MSIKGVTQIMYVGKEEARIITLLGRSIPIEYGDLRRIDYMYSAGLEVGYLDFIKYDNNTVRFEFGRKANDKISKTIDLISDKIPELEINEYHASELKFYQHSLFAIIISFVLGFPLGFIGLFLIWYYKKGTALWRMLITFLAVLLWSAWFIIPYLEYRTAMNDLNNVMDSYFNILNGLK